MYRKYDIIQCPDIEKFEKEKKYKCHMSRIFHTKCAIDTTQPELSPRHRLIAQKAEARKHEYIKRTRSSISPRFSVKGFPYSSSRPTSLLPISQKFKEESARSTRTLTTSMRDGTATSKSSVANTPLFRTPAPFVEPTDFDFLNNFVPFLPTQTRHEKAVKSSQKYFQTLSQQNQSNDGDDTNENDDSLDSYEDIDDGLSSISSESEDF